MAAQQEDEWSDSDEEELSEVETAVLLGVPDGSIDATSDLADVAVSRIGGKPAFLPSPEPPFASSHCTTCDKPMELLVQIWCPFEDSAYDRALYVWGCARAGCQNKPGSVRAWRGMRYNAEYAEKIKRKLAKRKEREAVPEKPKTTTNPFSLGGAGTAPTFGAGLGSAIFGSPAPTPTPAAAPPSQEDDEDDDDSSDASSTSSEESLLTAMASTSLNDSVWKDTPSYPPFYLNTVSEYLPPQSKPKISGVSDPTEETGPGKDISWAYEPYENSLDLDHAFERFAKRVSYEGEQCVRYELKGTPLPYCSDATFDLLFPAGDKRTFDSSKVPHCPHCNSARIFECQLMPNLVNVLKVQDEQTYANEEERRKVLEQQIKGTGDKEQKTGLDWGPCIIFSCEKDCAQSEDGKEELKSVWKEEVVLVQYDA